MKTKFETPMGYMCLKDERMEENVKSMFTGMYQEKEIEEVVIKTPETKKNYNTSSPFGRGYTNNYERVLATRNAVMKMFCGKVEKEIVFAQVF